MAMATTERGAPKEVLGTVDGLGAGIPPLCFCFCCEAPLPFLFRC